MSQTATMPSDIECVIAAGSDHHVFLCFGAHGEQ
jgi:hypothetical protein